MSCWGGPLFRGVVCSRQLKCKLNNPTGKFYKTVHLRWRTWNEDVVDKSHEGTHDLQTSTKRLAFWIYSMLDDGNKIHKISQVSTTYIQNDVSTSSIEFSITRLGNRHQLLLFNAPNLQTTDISRLRIGSKLKNKDFPSRTKNRTLKFCILVWLGSRGKMEKEKEYVRDLTE